METIKSISNDQSEILKNIMYLHNNDEPFECDITYGNGGFYKDIPEPRHRIDKEPLTEYVIEGCSTDLPFDNETISSIVFDPPFLTYIKNGRDSGAIMGKRFSGYWSYNELADHYFNTLKETARVLEKKGILVFKCQDIIHNHKMHCTHQNVIDWAAINGLRLKDLFILTAKHRMPANRGKQQHARIYHSYFLVFEKK